MNSSKETQGSHPTSAGKPKGKKTKPKSNTKQRQSDSRGKGKNKNSKAVKKGTPVTPKPKNKPVRAKPRGKSRTGSDVHAKTPKPGEGFLLHRNKDKFAWSKFQNSPDPKSLPMPSFSSQSSTKDRASDSAKASREKRNKPRSKSLLTSQQLLNLLKLDPGKEIAT
mmetsp:Transcript_11639/g.13370  ORF Transcript_11639/g.13370 Transcript_11639/m.13370 type:complete len:166 (-) Transcript_11639:275-772(-)